MYDAFALVDGGPAQATRGKFARDANDDRKMEESEWKAARVPTNVLKDYGFKACIETVTAVTAARCSPCTCPSSAPSYQ